MKRERSDRMPPPHGPKYFYKFQKSARPPPRGDSDFSTFYFSIGIRFFKGSRFWEPDILIFAQSLRARPRGATPILARFTLVLVSVFSREADLRSKERERSDRRVGSLSNLSFGR